jgi:hypothetical protein
MYFTRTATLCFSLAGGPKQIRKVSRGVGVVWKIKTCFLIASSLYFSLGGGC